MLPLLPGKRLVQRIAFGYGDEVHMVGHQAVGQNADIVRADVVAEDGEVDAAVGIGEEDVLAEVAALGDMMSHAGNDDAGETRHR